MRGTDMEDHAARAGEVTIDAYAGERHFVGRTTAVGDLLARTERYWRQARADGTATVSAFGLRHARDVARGELGDEDGLVVPRGHGRLVPVLVTAAGRRGAPVEAPFDVASKIILDGLHAVDDASGTAGGDEPLRQRLLTVYEPCDRPRRDR